MKVLIFTYSLQGGGAERVAANMANHWDEKGWRVTVVTISGVGTDFYRLNPSVHRVSLNLDQESSSLIVGLYRNLARVISLRKILKQERPDIALSLMWSCNILLSLASCGIAGLTTIGSEHTHPPKAKIGLLWGGIRKLLYGRLSAVTALTNQTATWIKENTSAKRVAVIQNAIKWPMSQSEPIISPAEKGFRSEDKVIISVGRLVKLKQMNALIDAFSMVCRDYPDWRLAILGEGPERVALESQIRRAGLGDRIALVGMVGNVGEWYELADLCVMTSKYEGLGNTLIEALSYEVPALSFDCDTGPREIIRDGIDGYLIPPDDVGLLAKKLGEIMGDSDHRKRLSERAKEARSRFSLDAISSQWEALFSECNSKR
jgi:glycosyltransferase involved in cell wall biosynthesis